MGIMKWVAGLVLVMGMLVPEAVAIGVGLSYSRSFSGAGYVPLGHDYVAGQSITVRIDFSHHVSDTIRAFGFTETAPAGWDLTGLSYLGNNVPTPLIAPQLGDSGTFNFIWHIIPEFPFSIEYTLSIPGTQREAVDFAGYCGYRYDGDAMSVEDGATLEGDNCVTISRSVGDYYPGQLVPVWVEIDHDFCGDGLSALGLMERLPEGWQFSCVLEGPGLVVEPTPGDEGEISFAFLDVPESPVVLIYYVRAPEVEVDNSPVIAGEAVYFLDAGQLQSATVETELYRLDTPVLPALNILPVIGGDLYVGVVALASSNSTELVLKNEGGQTLSGVVEWVEESNAFELAGDLNYFLAPGESQSLSLAFSPEDVGLQQATLSFRDCVNGEQLVKVTGAGTAYKSPWLSLYGCGVGAPGVAMGYGDGVLLLAVLLFFLVRNKRGSEVS